ncbi:hypothetical protein MTR_7g025600 [Medicago truncatula]|uniref:Uncharacterized protein n=1 Tax=Medicago truncatula TaxID=3880 RepID=G7KYY5_MEDTR|nr:hypothetical protein MTR_7g025600 [Medicago truncatula]
MGDVVVAAAIAVTDSDGAGDKTAATFFTTSSKAKLNCDTAACEKEEGFGFRSKGVGGMRVDGQQLLIVPSELTYGSKGVDIKVLKAEHVSLEMQIEFAQEIDIMRTVNHVKKYTILNYYFSLEKYRGFASNWSILTRTLLCFFQERNMRFSCKGI